jgi:hypothetical protein
MEREFIDAETQEDGPSALNASLLAIRESTSFDPETVGPTPTAQPLDLDAIDLSVLAGGATSSTIDGWTLKAQTPGAKVGLMVAGVTVVGGVALLLLTVAGLLLR